MSLDHAILGFLQYGPASGYDLKSVFDLSVQHFWPADQSQIYRTLARLSEQGLAAMERIVQRDRPDRKVYRITDAGSAELHRWLSTPLPMRGERNAHLVQVFFAGQLGDEQALSIFRGLAEQVRQGLAGLEAIPPECREFTERVGSPREHFFWMLTLEAGVRISEAYLEWLEDVIARIESGAVPPATATFHTPTENQGN